MRVAIYVRVSTQDQSCELQKTELTAYAKARGWTIMAIFEDKATGTHDRRPSLQRLISEARERKFDILLIWKLDRLFRSIKGMVSALQEFQDLGILFVSLKDQIDISTAAGRLMTHILASFAEFEASLIRERVAAGVRARIAKTGKWGPERKRDDEAAVSLRKKGLSVRQIAARLKISPTSVMRSLKGVPGTL